VPPVIRVEKLRKVYQLGDVTVEALRGVSLTIEKGAFVAVTGTSGSGKSTLMNILGLLDRPTEGQYFLEESDVSQLDRDERAVLRNRKIGFVFQSFNLLSRTSALENVELPLMYRGGMAPEERHRRARTLLEAVGLGERLDHRPHQLSGGQQQRVAVARALVNDPEVVFADEPTGNLDTKTSDEIMDLLQKLNTERGVTVLVITHEHDIADYAQRVIAFRDGQVVEDRPVTQRRGRYAAAVRG
jgi:putative ABC transport system ATP-binding protein